MVKINMAKREQEQRALQMVIDTFGMRPTEVPDDEYEEIKHTGITREEYLQKCQIFWDSAYKVALREVEAEDIKQMRAKDIYDEITGPCECGGKKYVAYAATMIGMVGILENDKMGIAHFKKEAQEQEYLVVCMNCHKIKFSRNMDTAIDAIHEVIKND